MAKNKKRKEENVEEKGYVVELKGILLLILAIIGLCPFGIIAEFIRGFACFLVGSLWGVLLVALAVYAIIMIINRKTPDITKGKNIGLLILILGILVLLHMTYVTGNVEIDPNKFTFKDGIEVIKDTASNIIYYIRNNTAPNQQFLEYIKNCASSAETGGGMIGAIFLVLLTSLLTLNGTRFVTIAFMVFGLVLYTGLSIREMIKKTGNDVKNIKNRVKPSKKKKEEVVEVIEPVEEVKPTSSKQYKFPPITLLKEKVKTDSKDNDAAIKTNVNIIIQTLADFNIQAKFVTSHVGPTVTEYEFEMKAGTKVSKLLSLNKELALALAASQVRIQAPIPGKSTVGIELPNKKTTIVGVREILESIPPTKKDAKLLAVLGRDIMGDAQWFEINKMPHLLIAGSTGSGKSVCINSILASILMRSKPDEVKMMLIDPKKVELSGYNGIPHLITPVVTDPKKASIALQRIVQEMESRYELFENSGTKNIESYNAAIDRKNAKAEEIDKVPKLPYIVVIIDELSDLMMVAAKDVEDSIMRITQMARAAGIHLIVATQRPSTDVITGVVKANIPSRISFAVASGIDSRTILDMVGAEKLLGHGDMLYLPQGTNNPVRIQGTFISEEESKKIIDAVCKQGEAHYDERFTVTDADRNATTMVGGSHGDYEEPLYDEIVDFIKETGKASASLLQRRFRLGYNRAARCIDLLEERGVIGPQNGSKPREVLIKKEDEEEE